MQKKSKFIFIRDSTLREGAELPGVELALKAKIEIARFLERMNVPEIEIGMPYGIKSCLPLANAVKSQKLRIKTSALILSYGPEWKEEIKIAAGSSIDRIEVLIPTSDILLKLKRYYKIRKETILGFLQQAVIYAKRYLPEVGIGLVDATRTDMELLIRLTKIAQKAGADRVIVYDTIGVATPSLMKKIISAIRKNSSIQIIVHCHDDFGLAVANSLAGIEAGADGADVVVNGLGDRGGNAAFEEVVLALEMLYGVKTGIKLSKITELSNMVEKNTGIRKSLVKPIVGEFTFLHSPVMHIRNAASGNYKGFEPFDPKVIGSERKYVFSLPVDYSVALEPFYKKIGFIPAKQQEIAIINMLRQKTKDAGLTGKQVLALIKKTITEKTKR